ncbi:helix-turn-helix domain-containing protein [Microbacterium esteraromaticum]|uniref:helix-turn-helix domain-containing protein n=1 Tax=Microbacterium esteraromaticum TaxID=57043 RepID=UPI003CC8059C
MRTREAAEFLQRAPQTLVNWRHTGIGPVYEKEGAARTRGAPVFYRVVELEKYLAEYPPRRSSRPGRNPR